MLRKKIIYTGITRAKEKLIILGKIESLNNALKNQEYLRQTNLKFLNDKNDILVNKQIRINDPDIPFEFLGEYDMEGITPYSFLDD